MITCIQKTFDSVADAGEGPGGPAPLFCVQTAVQRAQKNFFGDPLPPPPQPPSQRSGSATVIGAKCCSNKGLIFITARQKLAGILRSRI